MQSLKWLSALRYCVFGAAALLLAAGAVHAQELLKPYILVSNAPGAPEQALTQTREKLVSAGFEVVGAYSPYPNATVLAVTSS